MKAMLRKLVTGFTAAAFLLASVYCACAGTEHSAIGEAQKVGHPVSAPCHHDGESGSDHTSNPSPHDGHSGCDCSNFTTAPSNLSTSLDHLSFATAPFQLLALPFISDDTANLLLGRVISGNLTVPMPPPTLLRLHCALIV